MEWHLQLVHNVRSGVAPVVFHLVTAVSLVAAIVASAVELAAASPQHLRPSRQSYEQKRYIDHVYPLIFNSYIDSSPMCS